MSMTDALSILRIFSPSSGMNHNSTESKRIVITRLKFIGNLQPNEKIDARNLRVESNGIFTPLKRLFFGDSREGTMLFFSSTVDRAFEIINAHLHTQSTSEKIFCANVIQDLINSVKGLRAVQKTYAEDKLISCEIDVLVESIQGKIYEIQETHPEMFTIKDLCVMQLQSVSDKLKPIKHPHPMMDEEEEE